MASPATGSSQTHYAWRFVLEPLARTGYRLIAPDYRKAGVSSTPRDGYDGLTVAADLHTLGNDTIDVNLLVSVVGHDWGRWSPALDERQPEAPAALLAATTFAHGRSRMTSHGTASSGSASASAFAAASNVAS